MVAQQRTARGCVIKEDKKMTKGQKLSSAYRKAARVISNPKATTHEICSVLYDNKPFTTEEAIRLSLLHWEVNEWNATAGFWSQDRTGDVCALCQTSDTCWDCPLSKIALCCGPNSPWRDTLGGDKKRIVKALRTCLEKCLQTKTASLKKGTRKGGARDGVR